MHRSFSQPGGLKSVWSPSVTWASSWYLNRSLSLLISGGGGGVVPGGVVWVDGGGWVGVWLVCWNKSRLTLFGPGAKGGSVLLSRNKMKKQRCFGRGPAAACMIGTCLLGYICALFPISINILTSSAGALVLLSCALLLRLRALNTSTHVIRTIAPAARRCGFHF